ncbi:hypothetical protein IE81DRAFT_346244 [Ceraceosorus guamensis]|uniref:H-type lectin domain-containing protein n=1 Tax=Ceraceosorus guamensis TaxID=1522189 RepID=A0A316W1T5_9BASI|nr:hypothetical protein IE81DRAFT_346244 [Ceraceosorus guamensis]PWN43857.1 hypothetical protein IE81DRAFT_346244 [Ceraceosorus guamensis]
MSMLLAPYNNGMRLGQGFNSYTHSICVDDAVLIDPSRAENVLSNDGTTMRMLAQRMHKASVWRQMREYVEDGTPTEISTEPAADEEIPQPQNYEVPEDVPAQEPVESSDTLPASDGTAEESAVATLPAGETAAEASAESAVPDASSEPLTAADVQTQKDASTAEARARQAERNKQLAKDITATGKAMTSSTLKPDGELRKKAEAFDKVQKGRDGGLLRDDSGPAGKAWSVEKSRGTSQIVSYRAQFINKLSEVADDMNVSAALSVKTDSFGLSGRGSFVNTDKFHNSDIKFYLSVKVVNSSVNFKDALAYNPISSIQEGTKEHLECFGDSFISGFLEGGELNAVVLIKVLNDVKKSDILAEAKVVLTTGIDAEANGNLALAKRNIAMNTETSIQVSWAGGASIKPYDEEWTIDSLLAAAQRFPYLASQFPQRTHAILTRYENLRSYVAMRPKTVSKIGYENAAVYTGTLMDCYLEYKTLYKRIGTAILDVQAGRKRFKEPKSQENAPALSKAVELLNLQPFVDSLEGLEEAKTQMRAQMGAIVKEVDLITRDPAAATKERPPSFVGPASFAALIPAVEYKVRKLRSNPLSGELINDKVTEDGTKAALGSADITPRLFDQSKTQLILSNSEEIKVADLERDNVELAETTRLTAPVGSTTDGQPFCTLDYDLPEPIITEVSIGILGDCLQCLSCTYLDGLTVNIGGDIEDYPISKDGEPPHQQETTIEDGESEEDYLKRRDAAKAEKPWRKVLKGLGYGELITSARIEVDADHGETVQSVVGLYLVTNKGRSIQWAYTGERSSLYDMQQFEKPICDGYVSGFWGRSTETQGNCASGIDRLGLVWTQAISKSTVFDEENTIPCLSSSVNGESMPIALNAKTSKLVKFDRHLPGIPQLIYAPSTLALGAESPPSFNLSAKAGVDGFTLDHNAQPTGTAATKSSAASWMVLPEIDVMHIQAGSVHFEAEDIQSPIASKTVKFELPFKAGSKPKIVCWIIDYAATSTDYTLKAFASEESASSFRLSAGTDTASSSFKSMTIGWLAHDEGGVKEEPVQPKEQSKDAAAQPASTSAGATSAERADAAGAKPAEQKPTEKQEAKVKDSYKTTNALFYSHSKQVQLTSAKQSLELVMPAKFVRKPRKTFVAFNEIHGSASGPTFRACNATAVSNDTVKLDFEAEQKGLTVGVVFIAAL